MVDGQASDDELGRRLGAVIKHTREETGWSQRELAARLGSSQSAIQRLESGSASFLDVRLATDGLRLLGIRASFDARTVGLAARREQGDLVHACCIGYASRRVRRDGWDVRIEVEIGTGRYRGWIDLLAYRAIDRCLLCAEIKTEINDVGRIQRTSGWYEREAPNVARRFGWHPRTTTSALLVLCTSDNDLAVRLNLAALRTTFPSAARPLADWVTSPGTPAPAASMAMIDPRSRRAAWLRPTASEGRRTAAPYAGYAAAADVLRGREHRAR